MDPSRSDEVSAAGVARVDGADGGSDEKAPARSRRAEESRERILASAASCFSQNGFRRTRFEEIAEGAGVSRALVYAYFESKENLLRAVRDAVLEGWRAAVEPRIRDAGSATETLEAMLRGTLAYARTRPFLRAIIAEDVRVVLLGDDQMSERAIDAWRGELVAVLERGIAEGDFRDDLDVEHSADVMRAMQLGIIDRQHRGDGPIDVSSPAHVEAAVALIIAGLRR